MDAELKNAWIEALRSGEYEQGRKQLRYVAVGNDNDNDDAPRYCCLGVLADLLVKRGEGRWEGYSFVYGGNVYTETLGVDGDRDTPAERLGLFTSVAYGGLTDSVQEHLITANDTTRKSFAGIAAMVEQLL